MVSDFYISETSLKNKLFQSKLGASQTQTEQVELKLHKECADG